MCANSFIVKSPILFLEIEPIKVEFVIFSGQHTPLAKKLNPGKGSELVTKGMLNVNKKDHYLIM